MSTQREEEHNESSKPWIRRDTVRIRLLWVGLITFCLILLNDVRYVKSSPLYVVVLGFLINGGLILVFVFELRKLYRRLREGRTLRTDRASES
jgi:uncharacterized integral membrane protein